MPPNRSAELRRRLVAVDSLERAWIDATRAGWTAVRPYVDVLTHPTAFVAENRPHVPVVPE